MRCVNFLLAPTVVPCIELIMLKYLPIVLCGTAQIKDLCSKVFPVVLNQQNIIIIESRDDIDIVASQSKSVVVLKHQ